ncbi:MAG TPA: trehalose-phosphatase [Allosphingosinicella sp.]|uniref:trehalose-phosphatase n=1 Tax=Allosphingosinicella sp. TaxID=2823234 RepID=UPI002F29E4BB
MNIAYQTLPPASLADAALFLDFDGTLVELAETPDAIRVSPQLPHLLQRLAQRLDGRLAVVSGRSIQDLERYLSCRGLAVSGSHGLELRLADGSFVPLAAPRELDGVCEEVGRFAECEPGLLVEEKPFSVAVHYRRAPDRERQVREFMARLAVESGLSVQQGKMVTELRPAGADKGDAVRAFMLQSPFAGSRPIFVGDDLTDEDAFHAAAELGGGGVLVGHGRDSAAQWRLDGVCAVADWLERLASA